MNAIVTGHKNPDTDSVVSAIAAADLMSKRGLPSSPRMQGEPTPETSFVLGRFGFKAPQRLEKTAGQDLILVDHSDRGQAPDDLDKANLVAVIDHHKLGDVSTSTPLLMWVWPVGCTCTVLKNMYDFYGIEIPRDIAGILLGAILSDTLIFKSPTTTDEDKAAAAALASKVGVDDLEAFGMEMFKVKSAVDGVPPRELLFRDYKDFDMSGKKIGVGQLEVIDLSLLDAAKEGLKGALAEAKAEGRHTVFLLLTDIMKEGSELIYLSDEPDIVEKTFGVKGASGVWLPRVMSRKKDVIPKLEAAMK